MKDNKYAKDIEYIDVIKALENIMLIIIDTKKSAKADFNFLKYVSF